MRFFPSLTRLSLVLTVIAPIPAAYADEALKNDTVGPAMSLGPTLNFAGQKLRYSDDTLGDWQAYVALTGLAAVESNTSNASPKDFGDVSNAQFMLQKSSGWLQLFAMGGAYSQPALATNLNRPGFGGGSNT